jgi:hypothetical protein
MIGHRGGAWTFVLFAASVVACQAKGDAFYARVFPCDLGAPPEECGTTSTGEPLTCYDARQLGGQPVCSELCDQGESEGPHGGYACLASGVRLKLCRPTASRQDPALGCPPGLQCYRTDLLRDEGLCMAAPVCTDDKACSGDTIRTKCVGTLLREIYPETPLLTDNLHCVQDRCSTSTACQPGESCLAVVAPIPEAPDICVPNCDADMHCPPNFVCSREVSGTGAPRVCVPGLPGSRCTSSLDCMVGDCSDTGEGFSLCTTPCFTDEHCVPLITAWQAFMCVPAVGGSGKHCVSQNAFAGAPCQQPSDCPDGSVCYRYSPYGPSPFGECRLPCDAEGRCRARGGIPHVCLAGGEGGCYPGRFGLPCQETSECMTDFSCLMVPDDPDLNGPSGSICTIPCDTDADCDADPWTLNDGYCSAGFCRLAGGDNAPCLRDQHCRGRTCDVGSSGTVGICPAAASP